MFGPMTELPESDEQAEQVLRQGRNSNLGDSLVGIYCCQRGKGLSILEAYEATLLKYIEVVERKAAAQGQQAT